MAVSIGEYRQRIGCFATVLSSLKVRGCKRNTSSKQSKDFGPSLGVLIIRLSCLVALGAAIIPSSSFVLDPTQFGDVERNPGPNSDYKFHLISAGDFERFAVTVLGDRFNIKTLLTFSKGPDGGRDAAAHGVNIDLGGGNELKNQELVVQVKHTEKESETIGKNVYEKEKKKVEKLVQNVQLDTYIMFTNYKLAGGQEAAIVKCFKEAGAKYVITVGKETLSQWLNDSKRLQRKVICLYPRCHLKDLTDCRKAIQSFLLLERYKEDLKKTIYVEAFTKAREIVESDKGLVFITGDPGSGKTTVAKQLVVHLFDKYDSFTYYNITYPKDFDKYWIHAEKFIFFMDKMDSNSMKEWSKLEENLKTAIKEGSKFVFAGQAVAFKEALERSHLSDLYKCLCNTAIDLSDQQFNLPNDKKQEMLKKLVDMGDNNKLTKEALLKDDMVAHAAEINCPCFPLVASSLGSRYCLEKFKMHVATATVYNQKFLDQFFKWVQSTTSSSESCESLTLKRPRLESEYRRSSADNGDNITGSTFESCELPPLKRLRLQSEPMSTADNSTTVRSITADNVDNITGLTERLNKHVKICDNDNSTKDNITALIGILSDEYKDRASRVHPLPWLDTTRFELDKVYTKLGIVQRENSRSKLTNKTVELDDIFDKHEYTLRENPRTVLIEGSPGMGKTTLSLKLACDWASGRMSSKFPAVQLVFLIKCRDMKGDILEAINEQLFPLDEHSWKKKLHTVIKQQPQKVLLIVDGLDETPKAATEHVMNLLTRRCLRDCYVVATSRQEKGLEVRKYFDSLLEIEGYSIDDIKEYITRYFQDNDPSLAKRLIEKNFKTDDKLQTLATNPLNTVLLCVVFEEYDGELPSTVTELYDNIVYCITKRYCEKSKDLELKDKRLETWKETLGKLAYNGLFKGDLSFRESDLNDEEIQCTKMGFLYKEDSKEKIKQDHTYWFLHKTFQEYLAAFHFTQKVVRKELTVDDMAEQLKDATKFRQVLMFVSGMLHKKCNAVQHMAFVKKLGECVFLPNNTNEKVLGILCAVLSESSVDKDMAGIIHQFLPEYMIGGQPTYSCYTNRILPRILNLLCTKDGFNKEVYFDEFSHNCCKEDTLYVKSFCKTLTEKLVIRELILDGVDLVETARDLADMLSDNSTLEVLRLHSYNFTAESAKILAEGLRQNSTLKELDLKNNELGYDGVKAITAVLTRDIVSSTYMTALHTLSLRNNSCDEEGALVVAKMLSTNNTLEMLNMNWNPLGCEGVTCIADALKSNGTLNCLYLQNTDCGDEGAAAIADMLYSNNTLTELCISNLEVGTDDWQNEVGNEGVVALADALRVNSSLKKLHLINNNITDEEEEYLAEAWAVNTAREKLCLCVADDPDDDLIPEEEESVEETINFQCCADKY